MDYENTMSSIAPSQHFHPLRLFKDKHLENLNFSTLFYGQPWQFSEDFLYQKIVQSELLHNLGIFQPKF
jgi:hypothetical protein